MEQKSHEIKFLDLQNKQLRDTINSEFSGLPADLGVAQKRLFELECLVKTLQQKEP
jgi:hypothetical protein